MARAFARLNGLQVAGVPGLPGGRLDLDRLLQAARILNVDRKTIDRMVRTYGIQVESFKTK